MIPRGEGFTREEWRQMLMDTTTEELKLLAEESDGLTLGCEDEILTELQERLYLEAHSLATEAK